MQWILDLVKAILPGVVLALVGYFLTDAVSQRLKEHELQIDTVKSMQTVSAELQTLEIDRKTALARAAELAAYGKYSVPFFINVQEIGGQYGVEGALQGLRMVARSEPAAVCEQASAIIRNRTALYHWQSHLAALQLIGEVRCEKAKANVKAYEAQMNSLATLSMWVAEGSALEQSEFQKSRDAVKTALARLERPAPPAPGKSQF